MRTGELCPCGIGVPYEEHCAQVHRHGAGLGMNAEALMRARYSAYVVQDREFLLGSWHLDTRPVTLDFDAGLTWLGLEIVDAHAGGVLDAQGIVEFKARFSRNGEHLELHERSTFVRVDGRWHYVSGD